MGGWGRGHLQCQAPVAADRARQGRSRKHTCTNRQLWDAAWEARAGAGREMPAQTPMKGSWVASCRAGPSRE